VRAAKKGSFIKSGYEMLKLGISCTCKSSENIRSSSGGAEEQKGKRGSKPDENSVWHEKWCISDSPPPLKG